MSRPTITIATLFLCIPLVSVSGAKPSPGLAPGSSSGPPTIVLTGLGSTEKSLDVQYRIKNGSDHNIWVCDWQDAYGGPQFEVYLKMGEDEPTLVVQRRLDVLPAYGYRLQPTAHYVRLRPREERSESLSLPLPLNTERVETIGRQAQAPEQATRLSVEIGYYDEDLPGMVHHLLNEAERLSSTDVDFNLLTLNEYYFKGLLIKYLFGGSVGFNWCNESLGSRDDEVLIQYTNGLLKGEQILRIGIDGLFIPCEEKEEWPPHGRLPELTFWSRADIQYEPSMLEYFFPYAGQQSLLNTNEKQYVRSLKTAVLTDRQLLTDLAYEISKALPSNIVAGPVMAHVTCYRESERFTSFAVYNNTHIQTQEKRWFKCRSGFQSLKTPTADIRPFQVRVQCGANLKNLWYRLRLFCRVAADTKMVYPPLTQWCDAMTQAYTRTGPYDQNFVKAFVCPGAGEGKSHYAINPNCKPDSPADTVLLFESKAGWNQHGGPELFTFDNHDPKGGCVLLNDGTVKFIRTKEELQQLRWK